MGKKRYILLAAIGTTSLGALAAAGASLIPRRRKFRSRLRRVSDVLVELAGSRE